MVEWTNRIFEIWNETKSDENAKDIKTDSLFVFLRVCNIQKKKILYLYTYVYININACTYI